VTALVSAVADVAVEAIRTPSDGAHASSRNRHAHLALGCL